jgi:hypothetical protein
MKTFTNLLLTSTTLVICLLTGARAHAATFTETGDAGQLLGKAQNIGSIGAASEINGAVGKSLDIDLYKFVVDVSGMSTFDANPIKDKNGDQLNINMFLFDGIGRALFSIEPRDVDTMKFDFATAAGTYFLAIGSDDLDALDAKGNKIAGNDSGIDNPKGILAGWSAGNESIGAYNIKLSTVPDAIDPTAVPTPALLPGLIALGAKVMRKKKEEETMTQSVLEA